MKFASYTTGNGDATWGAELDGTLYDLGPSGTGLATSLKDAVTRGLVTGTVDVTGAPAASADSVTLLPVIPDPAKIICIGVNYSSHRDEVGKPGPDAPTVFTRFADTQMGSGAAAVRPATTTQFDYEGELALVIGSPAFHVAEADAWSVVAGFAPYNDFSVRDWQKAASQWIPGKNFPDTGGFGPYFTPVGDVSDFEALTLETRVNGEVRQSATLADLIFTVPQIIAYVTGFTALAPGDVIVTGTPGGVGMFMKPQGFIVAGDVVEVEISELGVLRNHVTQD
ncbi:MAG: hydrolase family protein [Microbacteriaceae bacterium]|nr:hydrolase family protein [Microbacteriaceae bacterium]